MTGREIAELLEKQYPDNKSIHIDTTRNQWFTAHFKDSLLQEISIVNSDGIAHLIYYIVADRMYIHQCDTFGEAVDAIFGIVACLSGMELSYRDALNKHKWLQNKIDASNRTLLRIKEHTRDNYFKETL